MKICPGNCFFNNSFRYTRRVIYGRTENTMKIHKKTAAFLAALTIFAALTAPCGYAYADNEETTAVSEPSSENQNDLVTSGAFSYSVLSEGKISIENCTATDKELVIPESIDGLTVAELGKKAFGSDNEKCAFETISLPATIEYISAENPFVFCEKLSAITVDSANKNYTAEDGILYSKDKKKLICYPINKSGTGFTLPEEVTELGTASLYNTGLSDIKLPSSLNKAGRNAFSHNYKLTSIDMSKTSLASIGDLAFADCSSLSEVLLPDSLNEIGNGAFMNCKKLEEITLPSNLTTIGQSAFINTSMSKITVPASVTEIGYSAFGYSIDESGNETADKNFVIIGTYGSAAHRYCTDFDTDYDYKNNFTFKTEEQIAEEEELLALERVTEGNYEYALINGEAVITFCTATDKVLNVPEKLGGAPVVGIYPVAFQPCGSEEIIIPETVKYIREMAFYSCSYVKKLTLPQSLESIGNNAFDNCAALEEINMGGASKIGSNVFIDCTSLKTVTIPGKCTSIDGVAPFAYCVALEEINVAEGDGSYASVDGVLMNKDKTELIAYPAARPCKSYKMPDSVKKVRSYAFPDCTVLEDVVLSKNLTEIQEYAFYGCLSLKSFRAYKKLETIGNFAFGYSINNNADTQNNEAEDILVDGFKLYAPKKSAAYNFGKDNGMDVITNTIRIGSKNIRVDMLGIIGGFAAAVIISFIGVFAGKKLRRKKESENLSNIKEKADENCKSKEADKADKTDDAALIGENQEGTDNDNEA